ncbi:MAG: DUF4249 domain-containing protein [Bacteroidetes bacterium]|nr:MAG: DUF4249 domain-containing protein [Bacteroidota bacterium]
MQLTKTYSCFALLLLLCSCEKEITVNLPPSKPSLVVEASINQQFPNLNYVYISRTVDYFNPDLSLNGVSNAQVFITSGSVSGTDTTWNEGSRIQLFDINNIPGVDSLLQGFTGIYFNPLLIPQVGVPYRLDIEVGSEKITGVTSIPKVVNIDTVYWRQELSTNKSDTNMFVTFEFNDGPEKNNYRLAIYTGQNPLLIGWGAAESFRTFDDSFIDNGKRPYSFFSPFKYGDTLNLYLSSVGRREYLFWESFVEAANNGGPFATPISVKSNIKGAIGSFTGYGVSFRRMILR